MNFTLIKNRKMPVILIIIAGLLTGLFLSSALKTIYANEYRNAFLIMLFFAAALVFPLIVAFVKKSFDPFEPIYLWILIYGFLYLAKPLVQILNNQKFLYGGEYLNGSLLLAILGLICFYLGYYANLGKKIAAVIPVIKRPISSKKLFYVAWGFILLGFWGLNHYIQISGGWREFWSKPHGLGGKAIISTAYIYELPELMVIGFILIYEIFIHRIIVEKKAVKIRNILGLVMAAIGGIGIYTIIWGSRTYSSWIILGAVILYFLKKQSRPKFKTVVITVLVIFLLLSFIPVYRGYVHLGSDFSQIINDLNFKKAMSVAFNPIDEFSSYISEVALVPNSIPYAYFSFYLKTTLHPIPRLIWHNKPTLFNPNWNDFLSKSGLPWGVAESMLGDFYAQLGTISVIICAFLSGILWKTFYQYLLRDPSNRSIALIYAVIFPNMFTYLSQSALIGFLKWTPYMVPSTILALILSREKKKSS